MRRSRLAALLMVSLLVAGNLGLTQPPVDAQLQGVWEVLSVERSGSPDLTPVAYTLTFNGEMVQFQGPGMLVDESFTLLPLSATLLPLDPAKVAAMALY
jgi:hypothetical protein